MLKRAVLLLACTFTTFACTDDDVVVEEPVVSGKKPGHEFKVDPESGKIEFKAEIVYFKYDDSSLTKQGMDRLNALADHMKQHKTTKLTDSGHCDERGSTEYNLALGDLRARSVISYLKNIGLDSQRITATSYGEERPAVEGPGEDAWAKNRRAEFTFTSL